MANQQINEFLSRCQTPESGCFASDPDALDTMLNFGGDSGIRTDLQRAAEASTSAAEAGIPLEETTYEPVTIEVAGTHLFAGMDRKIHKGEYYRLGHGEPQLVMEGDPDDNIDALRQRIAKCAHACGSAATGTCPLRTPQT